jgi:hypothetical protein
MIDKNYEYLKDQLKYTGFGEGLNNELKEKILKQEPYFNIRHQSKISENDLVSVLYFKKVDASEMVYFNRYQLTFKPEQSMEMMGQTFYINKENNIKLKEAYNLMNGRAVNKDLTNKEGEKYNAWLQKDFKDMDNEGNYKIKQFHQNYGYNLKDELAKLPIKELSNNQDKVSLIQSLQKGNLQSVTLTDGNKDQKIFIEANPQFKTINVYDGNLKKIEKETLTRGQSLEKIPSKNVISQNQSSTSRSNQQSMRAGDDESFGSNTKAIQKTRKKGLSH